jgi:outer membrane protein assembly factor BamB
VTTPGEEVWMHYTEALQFLDRNGKIQWEHYYAERMHGGVDAFMDEGILFVSRGLGVMDVFDSITGEHLWNIEVRGDDFTEVRVLGEEVYISATDGKVYCISVRSGEILWAVDTGSGLAFMDRREPPIFVELSHGILFIFTEDGKVLALAIDT